MHHHREKNPIISTHYDETKKRAYDTQIVRPKENLKSHGGLSQRRASCTNQRIKALRQAVIEPDA